MSTDNQTSFSSIFKRDADADTVDDAPPWKVGISMAATWSWGAAVAVAISVLHTLGIGPFLVWTFFNCISLALFGLYYTKIPNVRKWKYLMPMVLLWGFVGYFAIVMNMNTILAVLGGNMDIPSQGFLSGSAALYVTIATGLVITAFIGIKGLRGSVNTDAIQLILQFAGAIGILAVGLATGANADLVWVEGNQTQWAIGAALGFIFGATASGMQWQRIELFDNDRDKLKATLWGSGIFTVFLLITAGAAFVYVGGPLQSAFLIIAALAVATSTADSGSALLQYVSQRIWLPASVGTLFTLVGVLTFHLFADMGLTGIWTLYANVRWMVILGLLLCTLVYNVTGVPDGLRDAAKRWHLLIPDQVLEQANIDVGDPGTEPRPSDD